ncbi:MAG TPA: hypothetical protein VKQ36_09285 [Ktedonobacterales bacterium]|nr:hypothetical protein [Ktedonobacterales bacterium]
MIPPLRRNGTLPPGVHRATLSELLSAFPPINQQRQILNDSVQHAVEELYKLDPTLVIFVDGSYVTKKAEPNDVDLLIISPTYSVLALVTYLDRICPVEAVSLDGNVESSLPSVIFDLFTETRRGQSKGIIELVR